MKELQQKPHYTLAELTKGLDVVIKGDPDCVIEGVCTIQDTQPGHLTFLVNPLYKRYLNDVRAAAVILSAEEAELCPVNAVIARNPYYIYAKMAAFFIPQSIPPVGIHPTSVVGKNTQIDPSASIGPNCVLANNVQIGARVVLGAGCVIGEYSTLEEDSHLDANVTVYDRITIGKRVRVSSGTVIGSEGFGLAKQNGVWHKVPQLGGVILQDDVEIGTNCAIDRGAIGNTIIAKGAKLDNLIQVGHNVLIGENTAIAGCVGISGSAVIGKNCLIGGAAGVAGHITIADNVVITGGTEVTKSIRESGIYSSGVGGVVTNMERRKNTARLHRLDQLMQRVKTLESALQELTKRKVT